MEDIYFLNHTTEYLNKNRENFILCYQQYVSGLSIHFLIIADKNMYTTSYSFKYGFQYLILNQKFKGNFMNYTSLLT